MCVSRSVVSGSLRPHGLREAPPSVGFSRWEYWSGFPVPSLGESSRPRARTRVSHIAGRFFTIWVTREANLKSGMRIKNSTQPKIYCVEMRIFPERGCEVFNHHLQIVFFSFSGKVSFIPGFYVFSFPVYWELHLPLRGIVPEIKVHNVFLKLVHWQSKLFYHLH